MTGRDTLHDVPSPTRKGLPLNTEAVWAFAERYGITTTAALADATGIERTYLSKILSGDRNAHPAHVKKLAGVLRTTPLSLLGPEDPDAALDSLEEAS